MLRSSVYPSQAFRSRRGAVAWGQHLNEVCGSRPMEHSQVPNGLTIHPSRIVRDLFQHLPGEPFSQEPPHTLSLDKGTNLLDL